MVTNANDFAVNNTICDAFVAAWRKHQTNQIYSYQFPRALGLPHDIIDPRQPIKRMDVVYPLLESRLAPPLPDASATQQPAVDTRARPKRH